MVCSINTILYESLRKGDETGEKICSDVTACKLDSWSKYTMIGHLVKSSDKSDVAGKPMEILKNGKSLASNLVGDSTGRIFYTFRPILEGSFTLQMRFAGDATYCAKLGPTYNVTVNRLTIINLAIVGGIVYAATKKGKKFWQ